MNTPLRVAAALVLGTATLGAQQPQPSIPTDSAAVPVPAVGDMAPDFSFRAISKSGIAAKATRLVDYRGQTVVLWFFIKARTRG